MTNRMWNCCRTWKPWGTKLQFYKSKWILMLILQQTTMVMTGAWRGAQRADPDAETAATNTQTAEIDIQVHTINTIPLKQGALHCGELYFRSQFSARDTQCSYCGRKAKNNNQQYRIKCLIKNSNCLTLWEGLVLWIHYNLITNIQNHTTIHHVLLVWRHWSSIS